MPTSLLLVLGCSANVQNPVRCKPRGGFAPCPEVQQVQVHLQRQLSLEPLRAHLQGLQADACRELYRVAAGSDALLLRFGPKQSGRQPTLGQLGS